MSANEDLEFDQNATSNAQSSPQQTQPEAVQESRTTGFYKGESKFSPSGVTSGLSDRELLAPSGE